MCYFRIFGYNHWRDCFRLLDAETGRVASSRGVTWHHPEASWINPIRAAPTEPPRDVYVPMPMSVPVAALSSAPISAPAAPAPAATPPPTSMSNSLAPIPPRVSRKLEHEGYVEMPGRTHGESRAMRDVSWECAHRHGIRVGHEAMVSMLTKGESNNEAVRHGRASKNSPDLPPRMQQNCPQQVIMCPMLRTRLLQTFGDTQSMHQESSGLLQASALVPAQAKQLVAIVINAKRVYA